MLTLKKLKEMEPNSVIAHGEGFIEHPWFNGAKQVKDGGTLEEDGRSTKVAWIAKRGYIHDWVIYHSMDANFISARFLDDPCHLEVGYDRILKGGAKLHKVEDIKKLVPCDEEALKMYRN